MANLLFYLLKKADFLGEKMKFNVQRESRFGTCLGFFLTIIFVIICLTLIQI